MQQQSIVSFRLPNDVTLLVERMTHVQSAAFCILTPAGSLYEEPGKNGTAAALCDLMVRGAGEKSSRELSAALDSLGVQRNESVSWNSISFSGAALAAKIPDSLQIYADVLLRPALPESHFPAVMSGIEQSLLAAEDEPQRNVLIELRKRCYDSPWGRPVDGSLRELPLITREDLCQHHRRYVRPNETLIGVAGNVDPEQIRDCVEKYFGEWTPQPEPIIKRVLRDGRSDHIFHDSAQTHIGIAYDAVPYRDPDYYTAWAAVGILSGGSSSRLFTEVREKRGLCYSVYATLNTLLTEGRVLAYAGTTTERAQETLDVTVAEMKRLGEGIDEAELRRCKARAKSALIMQQESTGARAGAIARDWFHLGRTVTLAEIHERIDALRVDQIMDYIARHPAENFTVLTIGAEPLTVPH